jgi:hypothetical protein
VFHAKQRGLARDLGLVRHAVGGVLAALGLQLQDVRIAAEELRIGGHIVQRRAAEHRRVAQLPVLVEAMLDADLAGVGLAPAVVAVVQAKNCERSMPLFAPACRRSRGTAR